MLGYGKMDLSLDCNDPHTMMVLVKLLLLNKYRMIEKNTVLSIKKRGGISSVYSNRHLLDCSDGKNILDKEKF